MKKAIYISKNIIYIKGNTIKIGGIMISNNIKVTIPVAPQIIMDDFGWGNCKIGI